MKCRLTIMALLALVVVAVAVISQPAGGDAPPGFRNEHLNTTHDSTQINSPIN